jgi:hypothetical protein
VQTITTYTLIKSRETRRPINYICIATNWTWGFKLFNIAKFQSVVTSLMTQQSSAAYAWTYWIEKYSKLERLVPNAGYALTARTMYPLVIKLMRVVRSSVYIQSSLLAYMRLWIRNPWGCHTDVKYHDRSALLYSTAGAAKRAIDHVTQVADNRLLCAYFRRMGNVVCMLLGSVQLQCSCTAQHEDWKAEGQQEVHRCCWLHEIVQRPLTNRMIFTVAMLKQIKP